MQRQTGHMEDKKRTGLESQGTENAFSDGRDGKDGLLHEGINEPILIPSTIADLEGIRELVRKFRGRLLPFEKCPDFCLRIGGLEASFHKGQEELLEYCEALYLPQPVKMEIVGIVDDVPGGENLPCSIAVDTIKSRHHGSLLTFFSHYH
ncbi:protein SORF2A [Gallid alphaherpesvirus 2]|uniref:Uncharacterized gene 97 protein n=1 Tax=Gallid herpesvirus 2 (strain Chicken/Md5/ATCC VR-987) TaxID=10389 RepID=VG97_GAHVM|nr:protein SORF2A [Gallid alphaherpesvirus 2]Q9E6L4.1 RecName: Full=Uncharacterized gene 97 protein [Marek's disease herpesvirus type 1 strain MD5]AAG14271.1 N-terminus MDV1 S2 [Gallid alphaherpesvirus 2]ALX81039.1 SORF2-like [synthetic construct] [Gallid alphaherpesvirus 2]ALX81157.1 SORF2-like [synthetic construct] [Gallid alphaherpesvirus 2]AUB51160.1 protein SORF2A [Gallid alphaherpesvirus 2]